jgi:hypothetical protein
MDWAANTIWIARGYNNLADSRSGPFYRVQPAHDAAVNGGRLVILPGGSYPEAATLTKRLMVETVQNSAILGGS